MLFKENKIKKQKPLERFLSRMGLFSKSGQHSPEPDLNRSEMRSLKLHREISSKLNQRSLEEWTPLIEENIKDLKSKVTGEPHLENLARWEELVSNRDLEGLHLALESRDRSSIEMREVSPMRGVLFEDERLQTVFDG